MEILAKTRSLCPLCMNNIEAEIQGLNDEVSIVKNCPQHGEFASVFWKGKPDYKAWVKKNAPLAKQIQERVHRHLECPQHCGLCSEHSQKTCTVLLEICDVCNLNCPVCFADSKSSNTLNSFISLDDMKKKIDFLSQSISKSILQLSGGEPTLYPNLIELVEYASALFSAVQLNTNGLLLAKDKNLAKALKAAGLSWVFLQFDGTNDEIHKEIRGKSLQEIKMKAIENCKEAKLGVVLVTTLVEGVNDNNLGDLLDFALNHFPAVRGIHLQPMTFAGRNALAQNKKHITLPEVIQKLSEQSRGRIALEDAVPSSCEHSLCSFSCRYYVTENQGLEYIHKDRNACDCELIERDDAPKRSIETTIHSWKNPENPDNVKANSMENYKVNAFDEFLAKARAKTFSISCMAFQDIHTLDLERLQNCCVHIFDGEEKLIPFCAYNLTSLEGKSLYRDS